MCDVINLATRYTPFRNLVNDRAQCSEELLALQFLRSDRLQHYETIDRLLPINRKTLEGTILAEIIYCLVVW